MIIYGSTQKVDGLGLCPVVKLEKRAAIRGLGCALPEVRCLPEELAGEELERVVRERVGKLIDPETGLTFEEMGIIRDVKVSGSSVEVVFKPTSPFCPIALRLGLDIRRTVEGVEGVSSVRVICVDHMMADAINRILNREGR